MSLGDLIAETVFDASVGSGNISSPIALRPARSAVPARAWRRKRWGRPSSRISLAATRIASVRWVGIETG